MRGNDMRANACYTKKQIVMSALVCAVMILAVLLSSLYIMKELHHDCTGADCPVCAGIERCGRHLKQLGSGLAELPPPITVTFAAVILTVYFETILFSETPVSKKVRLNN